MKGEHISLTQHPNVNILGLFLIWAGRNPMRWTLLAASAAIAVTLWLPGEAAQPTASVAATAANDAPITFEQYRDWRLAFIERRQGELARQLAVTDLPAPRKARLE
jgi:hypothetical protein